MSMCKVDTGNSISVLHKNTGPDFEGQQKLIKDTTFNVTKCVELGILTEKQGKELLSTCSVKDLKDKTFQLKELGEKLVGRVLDEISGDWYARTKEQLSDNQKQGYRDGAKQYFKELFERQGVESLDDRIKELGYIQKDGFEFQSFKMGVLLNEMIQER